MRLSVRIAAALGAAACLCAAQAHEFKVGSIVLDHPYATPTLAGVRTGAVYFRGLKNSGDQPDRLISVRTPVAAHAEVNEMQMEGDVMRMRALPALDLPAGSTPSMRHGGRYHLMLRELNRPLQKGDRFPVTLEFERAGSKEVMVWVQQPRDSAADHNH
ncbi:MAG: hypothetical protein RLY71_3963 [Pseudomonadota bacterium]|jgi:copper(I)-binding protein